MTAEEILCRWAEARYGLHAVSRVELTEDHDPGWSEHTPGMGDYVEVAVWGPSQLGPHFETSLRHESFTDSIELTMEVARFAASLLTEVRE